MKTGLSRAILLAVIGTAAVTAAPSRLQFTPPAGWTSTEDPGTHLAVWSPPGGNAAVTFAPSMAFAGSAEEWQHQMWSRTIQTVKLAGPSESGTQGRFLTRMAICQAPDGSQPWMCLYTLVQDGHGETVLFYAANRNLFLVHLATVNRMVQHITVGPVSNDAGNHAPVPGITPAAPDVPVPASAPGGDTVPALAYAEPAGFYRSAIQPPTSYTSNVTNAGMDVYQFRPFNGDIVAGFRRTLLADWIAPGSREQVLASAPQFSEVRVPGATTALVARFQENHTGMIGERRRVLVVVGNQAAIVDLQAHSTGGWNMVAPALGAVLDSLRVERAPAPPSLAAGPGPGATALAGLYMAMKSKYMAGLYGVPGSGGYKTALHYYVFSPDGRVYCCYDFPPGGNEQAWRQFNFDAAQRADPVNTGRYRIDGNQLLIQMSDQNAQMVTARIKDANHVEIGTVTYERQQ